MATGDIIMQYAASSAMTITLASLASGSAQQSTAYVNTGSNYLDGVLVVKLTTTTGTHGGDLACYVYGWATPDNTNFTSPVTTDSDMLMVISTGMNLIGPAVVNFGTSATGTTSRVAVIPSVANFFGGQLPQRFGFSIENKCLPLASAAASHSVIFFPTFENVST